MTCPQFHHCQENAYQCETCTTAGTLKVYTYPLNRIVCIEKLILAVLMVIYTAMSPTLVRSLQIYKCSQDIYLSKTTTVCNDKHMSTGLMVASSQFLQCHENTCWLESWTTTCAVWMYLSYKHDCNAKLMPTILVVTCAQVLYCQESTYWWETCTTTCALRMFPSCKHWS